jgi:hypothetical protein
MSKHFTSFSFFFRYHIHIPRPQKNKLSQTVSEALCWICHMAGRVRRELFSQLELKFTFREDQQLSLSLKDPLG